MTLGEKIYKLRTEKGISQETMANDLYVSRQAVSKWETDSSVPDLDKIKLLADYFEISIDELVSEKVVNNIKEINSEKYDVNKKMEVIKYCPKCNAHTLHKESK